MDEFEALLSAAARERGMAVQRSHRPSERRSTATIEQSIRSPYRAAAAATPALAGARAQLQVVRAAAGADTTPTALRGYATAYEAGYPMWDMFGPYTEVVSQGAGSDSLAANPDVKFLLNHRDMPMARHFPGQDAQDHAEGFLHLSEDDHGLVSLAYPLMSLPVSQHVLNAVEAGLIDEMSFAFVITAGTWSPDYSEFRIQAYDINRGDTSAVTYGANPHTEISAERSTEEPAPTGLSTVQMAAARKALHGHLTRTR